MADLSRADCLQSTGDSHQPLYYLGPEDSSRVLRQTNHGHLRLSPIFPASLRAVCVCMRVYVCCLLFHSLPLKKSRSEAAPPNSSLVSLHPQGATLMWEAVRMALRMALGEL